MADASASPPILRLKRSAQSGSKAMAADYAVVYTESTISGIAYIVMGAELDLSTMEAGDVIDVRVRKVIVPGGDWVNHDEKQFTGVQPTGHPSKHIGPTPNVYGVSIDMRQPAGPFRTVPCEFFDAKRIGMP